MIICIGLYWSTCDNVMVHKTQCPQTLSLLRAVSGIDGNKANIYHAYLELHYAYCFDCACYGYGYAMLEISYNLCGYVLSGGGEWGLFESAMPLSTPNKIPDRTLALKSSGMSSYVLMLPH